MKAFVQGEKELLPLQEEVTAESIKDALGYTPADAEDIIECIEDSDDSALCVTDKDGNVITRTDGEGFKAVDVYVGEDQKSVAEHLNDSSKHIGNEIELTDDKAFYVTDNQGNILFKVDGNGVHAAEVYVGDETVAALIENAYAALVDSAPDTLNTLNELAVAIKEHHDVTDVLDEAITKKANDSDLKEHTGNSNIHLGDEIALDDKEHLYIVDSQGNIIARFDGDGLDVTDLKIGSIHFSEHIQEIAAGGSVCSHEYVLIQELGRDLTDYTNWRNLEYCTSCGKVHANLLHSDHLLKFTYYSTSGAYSVSAIDTSIFGTIKIPSAYNGTPVGSIDNFANCNNITGVIIPSTVDYIDYSAFAGCNNLKYVIFEDTESEWRVYTSEGSDADWIDFYIAEKSPSELATLLTSTYEDWSWRKFTQRKVN